MNCVECHRPFHFTAPGQSGRVQGWYRIHEQGPNGNRCLDRGACARAARELQPSLFDEVPAKGIEPEHTQQGATSSVTGQNRNDPPQREGGGSNR